MIGDDLHRKIQVGGSKGRGFVVMNGNHSLTVFVSCGNLSVCIDSHNFLIAGSISIVVVGIFISKIHIFLQRICSADVHYYCFLANREPHIRIFKRKILYLYVVDVGTARHYNL